MVSIIGRSQFFDRRWITNYSKIFSSPYVIYTSVTRVGFEWFNSGFDLDADVVVSKTLYPEPSLRARQILYKSHKVQSKFTVTGFYKENLKFGHTTRFNHEQRLAKRWAYDAALTGRQAERQPDLEWDTGINVNYSPSSREALTLRLQAAGPTKPHTIVGNYRTSVVVSVSLRIGV